MDVGHSFALYADFSGSGKAYIPFPDSKSHRIPIADLADPEVRQRLIAVWTDPRGLDPSRRTAEVTKEVADHLASLARSLEFAGHAPQSVAQFLMRCLFTMFAEDVGLPPANAFTEMLERFREEPETFRRMASALWAGMDRGGFSAPVVEDLLRFNGGLFTHHEALLLDTPQIELLILAAKADRQSVEPAIFGTLLEHALDARERHTLGDHCR